MPRGHLSVRVDASHRHHHLWNNTGVWWVHYTLNVDCRTRRVRRSLKTGSLGEAIRRRDATCSKFKLIPNGPKPGEWFCQSCGKFFDVPYKSNEGATT